MVNQPLTDPIRERRLAPKTFLLGTQGELQKMPEGRPFDSVDVHDHPPPQTDFPPLTRSPGDLENPGRSGCLQPKERPTKGRQARLCPWALPRRMDGFRKAHALELLRWGMRRPVFDRSPGAPQNQRQSPSIRIVKSRAWVRLMRTLS